VTVLTRIVISFYDWLLFSLSAGLADCTVTWSSLDIRPLSLSLRYMTPFGSVRWQIPPPPWNTRHVSCSRYTQKRLNKIRNSAW
jgi:hypothetical protein